MRLASDYFIRQMKELFAMMGWNYKDDQMNLLYERLMKERVEVEDFRKAHHVMQDELRFTVPSFILKVRGFQAERREREAVNLKERSEREIMELIRDDISVGCEPSEQCRQCAKEYCRTMGKYAVRGIFAITGRRMSTEQVFSEMDKKFPGQGWDVIPERETT